MRKRVITGLCLTAALLSACSGTITVKSPPSSTIQTSETTSTPLPTPVPTVPAAPEPAPSITIVIEVRDGDILERDIILQLTAAFSMTEEEVKGALAGAESSLVEEAKGFRRMEGMIVPGTYEVKGEDLYYWIGRWIVQAEQRHDRIAEGVTGKNNLTAGERVILASVVEADTNLVDSYESTVANVYLNRIKKNDTFGSCPTVEYA
jgi:cell division protein YceG involved in septum cleavage